MAKKYYVEIVVVDESGKKTKISVPADDVFNTGHVDAVVEKSAKQVPKEG